MNGIRWGARRVHHERFIPRLRIAILGHLCALRTTSSPRIGRAAEHGRQERRNRTGWKAIVSASARSPSSRLLRDGGSGLLVWVNTQGWHGLQKPELEKRIRKEDLYIKAVRIVARDGGLGPAGEGGLK